MKGEFPNLLSEKATMLGALNREDLALVGVLYLFLSWMKVLGIFSTISCFGLVLFIKFLKNKLPKGFLEGIKDRNLISMEEFKFEKD